MAFEMEILKVDRVILKLVRAILKSKGVQTGIRNVPTTRIWDCPKYPGTVLTVSEQDHHLKALGTFWAPAPEAPAKRQKRSYTEVDRLASLQWMYALATNRTLFVSWVLARPLNLLDPRSGSSRPPRPSHA